MFTVWTFDNYTCTDIQVYSGTLEECLNYTEDDTDNEFYIQYPDGYTVYER